MGDMRNQYSATRRQDMPGFKVTETVKETRTVQRTLEFQVNGSEKETKPPKVSKTIDAEVINEECRKNLNGLKKEEEESDTEGRNLRGNLYPVEKKEKNPVTIQKNNSQVLKNSDKVLGNNHFYLIIPVMIILLGIACFYYFPKEQQKPPKFENIVNFYLKIKSIREKLQEEDIPSSSIRIVNRTLMSYFREETHVQPTVILLLATEKNNPYMCCFMWDIIDSVKTLYFEDEYTVGHIKFEELSLKSENEGKAHLENSINQIVESGGKNISLITMEDIDQFPVNTLSKVHTYFDNENAPHKNVVFLLTATTKFTKGKCVSDIAKEHFDKGWNNYAEEHRRALMGRMLSNVALLRPIDIKNNNCNNHSKCNTHVHRGLDTV